MFDYLNTTVTKGEMVSTFVMVLIAYNIIGSMIAKALYHIKDTTDSRVDNVIWSTLKIGLVKTRKAIDMLLGNPKH